MYKLGEQKRPGEYFDLDTKRYAELLAAKTGLPAYELKTAEAKLSKGAQTVYLGWLMAGKVKGLKKAEKSFDIKAVGGVGMAATDEQLAYIRKANAFPETLPVFALRGGLEVEKLHGMYKVMMSTMQKAAKKDAEKSDDEMLKLMVNGGDLVNEDDLSALADFIATT